MNLGPQRYRETVTRLPIIALDRRQQLANNPQDLAIIQLNEAVPEINQIELNNTLSAGHCDPSTVTITAWNLERGRYWAKAVDLIQSSPALKTSDILLLSEMDYGMARSHNHHTTRDMAKSLQMNYAYAIEFLELSLGSDAEQIQYQGVQNTCGYHGNAILSRYPLTQLQLLRFPGIEKWYQSDQCRLGGRIALLADVQLGQYTVTVVSLHFESGWHSGSEREQQSQWLVETLKPISAQHPIIIGGDFNAVPSSKPISIFRSAGYLVDDINDLATPTLQQIESDRVTLVKHHIDYILTYGLPTSAYSQPAQVVIGEWYGEGHFQMLSDHAAVTLKITLPH